MKLRLEELLIQNLEGKWAEDSFFYRPKEKALEQLIEIAGVNHGYDVNAWREWLKRNSKRPRKKSK